MKKWVLALSLVPFLLAGFAGQSQAALPIQLIVNGERVETDSPPTMMNGRTLVSLHSLQELSLLLNWNHRTKQVTISAANVDTLTLTIGSKEALYGSKKMNLDVPAQLVNNRVYVPLRFISETFNSKVDWSQAHRSVSITTGLHAIDLEALHKETDLVKARKLAFVLPAINKPTLGNSKELSSNILYFPEGEVLRYFHSWGNHIMYYEIKNNEKVLVWEAIENEDGTYSQERGTRPARGNEVYFESIRTTEDVQFGRPSSTEVYTGKIGTEDSLAALIQKIPNEVRTDMK